MPDEVARVPLHITGPPQQQQKPQQQAIPIDKVLAELGKYVVQLRFMEEQAQELTTRVGILSNVLQNQNKQLAELQATVQLYEAKYGKIEPEPNPKPGPGQAIGGAEAEPGQAKPEPN